MSLWQRLSMTVVAMLLASLLIGLAWSNLLGGTMPSYLSGIVGGLAALPVWELLKGFRPDKSPPRQEP